ncbi:sensor histidine kinase [Virgibacillus sp. NKC19-3]|uniref:HAMP domain-containing sensor histidine kinase n=1 Tax=Virgibacillus saliphilus TaxID=2831674 RepID=UPI001C9B249F|nr:histidine kinase dimerization/phospho-acceptor domain-containing protein [Virgibacillus sp. NKC19-3]MBY7141908.1 sensor histidine kinase [Virgibacillus sp. NKC19-3]
MRKKVSFFRRYLVIQFLLLILLSVSLLVIVGSVLPPINEGNISLLQQYYQFIFFMIFLITIIIFISMIFFFRLHKRISRLKNAMDVPTGEYPFPKPVAVRTDRMDEIDQLKVSFNRMIEQLEESHKREFEEESLKRWLIANLSHDLRTPLTIMRGHVSELEKEPLSEEGSASLNEIDHTISRVSNLMEDLLSYTLLTSGKYPYNPVSTDMLRLVRASVAAWYPVFDKEHFYFDMDLPEDSTFYWKVDPEWMTRVLDNLFQNILRHAAKGKYAKIMMDTEKEQIIVADNGPGMEASSYDRGAGIGLSITNYMLKQMKLQAHFSSSNQGTIVEIDKS